MVKGPKKEDASRNRADPREKESRQILDRVARDSETIGTSSMSRTARQVSDHFLGREDPRDDEIEIWGKRIARILALLAFIGLAAHLYFTYVVN